MRRLSKGWRNFIILVLILALGTGGAYALAPWIESLQFRWDYYNQAGWLQYINRMDAWFYHPVDYTTLDVTYTPTEQNLALYSNQVIDLGQGYFVTGLFGVSDWMMCVNVYGRKDTRDLVLLAQGSENSAYPEKESQFRFAKDALFGYQVTLPMAAPKTVENGEITLTVTFPNGESVTRTVPVSAEPLHPQPGKW